jgi:hypothetical protein
MDAQATGEAFRSQKITSSTSKPEISFPVFYFCGAVLPSCIRIRFHILNADPDPETQIIAYPDPKP